MKQGFMGIGGAAKCSELCAKRGGNGYGVCADEDRP